METCDHGLEHQADVRPSPPTVRWKQSFSRAIGRAEVENSPRGDGWDGLNHTPLSIALVSAIHAPHRQPDKTRVRQAASDGFCTRQAQDPELAGHLWDVSHRNDWNR